MSSRKKYHASTKGQPTKRTLGLARTIPEKLLSCVISVVLVVGLMPLPAFAQGDASAGQGLQAGAIDGSFLLDAQSGEMPQSGDAGSSDIDAGQVTLDPMSNGMLRGGGTQSSPYLIEDTADWKAFAEDVRNDVGAKYYTLANDVTINVAIGTDEHPFTGYFDGAGHTITVNISDMGSQGAAPFRCIAGASIHDVSVAGSITGTAHASGLVGFALRGTNTISRVTVTADVNGSSYVGGIVGNGKTARVNLDNCIYGGTLKGGSNFAGGLMGWSEGSALSINNCLFKGSYTGNGKFHPIAVREAGKTMTVDDAGAYFVSTVSSSIEVDNLVIDGVVVYTEPNIPAETFCKSLKVGGKDSGVYLPGDLRPDAGDLKSIYRVGWDAPNPYASWFDIVFNSAALSKDNDYFTRIVNEYGQPANPDEAGGYFLRVSGMGEYRGTVNFAFRMTESFGPASDDKTKVAGSEEFPYVVPDARAWEEFSLAVASGLDFAGEYVKMTADVAADFMVGEMSSKPFSGSFDGDGHTLTANMTADPDDPGAAPFRCVDGATIKNLVVGGKVTGYESAAGLVGFVIGSEPSVIENVTVGATVEGVTSGAGFVGCADGASVAMRNCVFSGVLANSESGRKWATMAGFLGRGTNCQLEMSNCINVGTLDNVLRYYPIACLAGSEGSKTLEDVYYVGDIFGPLNVFDETDAEAVHVNQIEGAFNRKVLAADGKHYYVDSGAVIEGVPAVVAYTGQVITLNYTVRDSSGNVLMKGIDYEESLSGTLKDEGAYTLKVTGIGEYAGTVSREFMVERQLSGSGTLQRPYIIASQSDWNIFANVVKNGYSYEGEFVRLDANISIGNVPVGTGASPFKGTFNGNRRTLNIAFSSGSEGTAPFQHIENAVIRDLTVTGYTMGDYASGLVGDLRGDASAIDSVTVNAVVSGGPHLAGFVGRSSSLGGAVELSNCIFGGAINAPDVSGAAAGGFVGWAENIEVNPANCLFKGSLGNVETFHPLGLNCVAVDKGASGDVGVYYTGAGAPRKGEGGPDLPGYSAIVRVFGDGETVPKGTFCKKLLINGRETGCFVPADAVFQGVKPAYDAENLRDLLTNNPVVVKLDGATLGRVGFGGNDYNLYFEQNGERIGTEEDFSGAKPGEYELVAEAAPRSNYRGSIVASFRVFDLGAESSSAGNVYHIRSAEEWDEFCAVVATGYSFVGESVKLEADVSIKTMAGSQERPFAGSFYGQGHTITAALDAGSEIAAPFACISSASIEDVTVEGTVSGGSHSAGLVGIVQGGNKSTIRNVSVKANVDGGEYVGGIIGNVVQSELDLFDSYFSGTISEGSSFAGGLIGWSDVATLSVENCLFAGSAEKPTVFHPIALRKNHGKQMLALYDRAYYVSTQSPTANSGSYTPANGTVIYTKEVYPESKLCSALKLVDGNVYYVPCAFSPIADEYDLVASGIAPAPVVVSVDGSVLAAGEDYTVSYEKDGVSVDTITEPGDYVLNLVGVPDDTVGAQAVGLITVNNVSARSIRLSNNAVMLGTEVGLNTFQLTATVQPDNTSDKSVVWESTDESVVTVEDGLLTAHTAGSASVIASTADGLLHARCNVTVVKSAARVPASPTARELVYNGNAQELVSTGKAVGGTMVYGLANSGPFVAGVPTATNVGSYYVYYRAEGDENHTNAELGGPVVVHIAKANWNVAPVTGDVKSGGSMLDLKSLMDLPRSAQVSFALSSGSECGCSLEDSILTTGSVAGECIADYTIEGDDNHYASYGQLHVNVVDEEVRAFKRIEQADATFADSGTQLSDPVIEIDDEGEIVSQKAYYQGTLRNGDPYDRIEAKPTEAGTYSVHVTCETANSYYAGSTTFEVKPVDIGGAAVTLGDALVYNGDEQTQDITEVTLRDGTHISDSNSYFVSGNKGTEAGTYTLTVTGSPTGNYTGSTTREFTIGLGSAEVTALPSAKEGLRYTGEPQDLVNVGAAEQESMVYSLDGKSWSHSSPQATDVGTYLVQYKVAPDDVNYKEGNFGTLEVTIGKSLSSVVSPPTAVPGLVFGYTSTGLVREWRLVQPGEAEGGTMVYSLNGENWSVAVPTASNAGTYHVRYKVAGDDNHDDYAPSGSVDVVIDPAESNIATEPVGKNSVYTGEEQGLITAGLADGGTMVYRLGDDGEFTEDIPTAVNAGTYYVRYRVEADANYHGLEGSFVRAVIRKADWPATVQTSVTIPYNGSTFDLSSLVTGLPEGTGLSFALEPGRECGCSVSGHALVTGNMIGECRVNCTIAGDANHNERTVPISVNLTAKDIVDFGGVEQAGATYAPGGATLGDPTYSAPEGLEGPPQISYTGMLRSGSPYTNVNEKPTEAGSYGVYVIFQSQEAYYVGGAAFTIAPADITKAKVEPASKLVYNGSPQKQDVVVTLDGVDITEYCDVIGNEATNVGSYTLTVTAKDSSNYTGSASATWSIAGKSVTAKANNASFVYDGAYHGISVEVSDPASGATVKYGTTKDVYDRTTSPTIRDVGSLTVYWQASAPNYETTTGSAIVTITSAAASYKPMFRLYNWWTGEHFYTGAVNERDFLVSLGWTYEGVGWNAPLVGDDVYRLYNPYSGDHHFTLSARERDVCVAAGWRYEGVGWKSGGTVKVYREYNPYADAYYHNYTKDLAEHNYLCSIGWKDEGVGWYGV